MGARTVNFLEDLPKIQQYIDKRVRVQAKINDPISAIEVGFKICQKTGFVLNFDTREAHALLMFDRKLSEGLWVRRYATWSAM